VPSHRHLLALLASPALAVVVVARVFRRGGLGNGMQTLTSEEVSYNHGVGGSKKYGFIARMSQSHNYSFVYYQYWLLVQAWRHRHAPSYTAGG
jgi:hypothetical protein